MARLSVVIFEDREANLWVGSDHGLTRYRDDPLTSLGKTQGFPDNGPAALLWITRKEYGQAMTMAC